MRSHVKDLGRALVLCLGFETDPPTLTPNCPKGGALQIPGQAVSVTCPGGKVTGMKAPHLMVIPGAESTG